MSSLDEPILQQPALFKLYIALIRTSGDFPTQLWVSLDKQPRFGFPRHGGGFVLIDAHLRCRASTVCTPIFNEEWQMTPTLHQVRFANALGRDQPLTSPSFLRIPGLLGRDRSSVCSSPSWINAAARRDVYAPSPFKPSASCCLRAAQYP